MVSHQQFSQIAAAVAATVMLAGVMSFSSAQTVLKDGDSISGYVQNTSPTFTFRNPAVKGTPTQKARGIQYTFVAQRGDYIEIAVDPEDGSTLKPVLVLLNPNGRQVGFSNTSNILRYTAPTTGTYRLLVLGGSNTLGRYTLAIDGLSTPKTATQISQADQVMTDVLRLRPIGCGVPNVARIKIGNEERCTRDIEAGVYTYDDTTKRITLVDSRRELLAQKLQINVLERCPSPATSVAQITMTDPQDGKDYTYCATPTRYIKAGTYRYNVTTDDLFPVTGTPVTTQPTPQPSPSPIATSDRRRQLLQTDYGLTVLDGCPANRTNLVVVAFPENDQSYIYCANPNRLVRAGEYTNNATTGDLDPAQKPAPACTVSIGGVCLVK